MSSTRHRQPGQEASYQPPEAPSAGGRGRAWGAVVVAVLAPLAVGAALMFSAAAAGAPGGLADDLQYAGALAVCLWLVARRPADRTLLRAPGPAVLAGLAVGALRCAVWLAILPVDRPAHPATVLAAVAGQVLLVAPAEELQFRGIVLSRLLAVARPWLAVAVAVALFTALHAHEEAWFLLPSVAADAVLFTALRARYRCLGGAFAAHALFNAIAVTLPASTGVSSATVAIYVSVVVAVDAAAAVWLFRRADGLRTEPSR